MGRKDPGYNHVRLHLFQSVIVEILDNLILNGFRFRPFPEHLLNDRKNVRIWCKKYNFNHALPPPIVHIILYIVFSQSLNCILLLNSNLYAILYIPIFYLFFLFYYANNTYFLMQL